MLTRRSRSIRHDAVDDLVQLDDAAIDIERRTRDLGLPDGLWWAVATLGGLAGGAAALIWALPLGDELAMAAGVSVCAGVSYAAARRWGHRQFRWPIVLMDGVKAAVAAPCVFLVGQFVDDVLRRWW
jgi:hypothetical protein